MIDVRNRYHHLCASVKTNISLWTTIATLLAILIGAFGANATDAEVSRAVQKVKAEVLTKQEQTIDQVLKTLAALEVKVTNGDTLMMMEFVLTDINRLKRERKKALPTEVDEIDADLRKRKAQFDDLMDSLRIDPTPLD